MVGLPLVTIGKGKINQGIITQVRIWFLWITLTCIAVNTWGMVVHCRVIQGKFYQTMITQGKDRVNEGKFQLGRYIPGIRLL